MHSYENRSEIRALRGYADRAAGGVDGGLRAVEAADAAWPAPTRRHAVSRRKRWRRRRKRSSRRRSRR
jgi:hypothetical protein